MAKTKKKASKKESQKPTLLPKFRLTFGEVLQAFKSSESIDDTYCLLAGPYWSATGRHD